MSLPTPNTRKEQYLNAIATGNAGGLPTPITREEEYLEAIAKSGGGSGDGDMKKSVYDSDLAVANAGGISAFVDDAVSGKVDKEAGKGLSTNDYSDTEKGKVTANAEAIEAMVNVNGCCNRIPRGESTSTAGVTFTVNANNSITLSGENNTANSAYFAILMSAEAAEYVFKNFETAKSGVFAWLRDINGNQIANSTDNGSGAKVQCPNGVGIYMLEVASGTSFSTPFTVYPMLYDARLNPTGYVPYAMTNRELTENKQNKINVKHVIFSDYQINAGATEYFSMSYIATEAQISMANILLIVWDGVQAKDSWSEIDCTLFYDAISNRWGVYNRGSGGKAYVSFTVLYY